MVDVNGWFDNGAGFTPLPPGRVLDTRERPLPNPCYQAGGNDPAGDIATLDIASFLAVSDCKTGGSP